MKKFAKFFSKIAMSSSMGSIGLIVIIAVGVIASINEYLLPIKPWEWFLELSFFPKTCIFIVIVVFSILGAPYLVKGGDSLPHNHA